MYTQFILIQPGHQQKIIFHLRRLKPINIGKTLFKFQVPLAWNKIPHELRIGTMSFFKTNYKKHLLKNYMDSS